MIVDPAELLTYIGKTSPTDAERGKAALIQRFSEAAVKKFLGYDPEYGQVTEYLPSGNFRAFEDVNAIDKSGNRIIFQRAAVLRLGLTKLPVRTITAIYEDLSGYAGTGEDAFNETTRLTEGVDFFRDLNAEGLCKSGQLIRMYGGWASVPRSVKVTYYGGYTAAELNGDSGEVVNAGDLKLACIKAFYDEWNASIRNPLLSSRSLKDYSESYVQQMPNAGSLSSSVRSLLQPYRSYTRRVAA